MNQVKVNFFQIFGGIMIAALVSGVTSYFTISYRLNYDNDLNMKKQIFFDISSESGNRLQVLNELKDYSSSQEYPNNVPKLIIKAKSLKVDWERKIHTFSALIVKYYSKELYREFHKKINDKFFQIHIELIKNGHPLSKEESKRIDKKTEYIER